MYVSYKIVFLDVLLVKNDKNDQKGSNNYQI